MSKSKTFSSLENEVAAMAEELVEQVSAAIGQAHDHANRGAARMLAEIGVCAFEHIERPPDFDVVIAACLDGEPEPDDYHFGKLAANVAVIKFRCGEIANLKNGKTRPKATEPKGGAGIEEIRSIKFSDKANSERLESVYKGTLYYHNHEWFEWDCNRWRADEKGAHLRAKTVGQSIREELLTDGVTDPELSKHYYRAAKNAESARGIRDTLDLAHSMPTFDGDTIEWDADRWLFNVKNGTVDLKTGKLKSHRREDYITRISTTKYDPNAKCPRFERFLHEIFDGDEALISYVQWAVGYSLTGLTRHHVFFVLWGDGSNGKTTLIELLRHVIGSGYFHQMSSDDLLMSFHPRHLSPIAQLQGKRFVVASETNENRQLNESPVKQLTGGDSVRANLMRCDAHEFKPVLKLWLMTNHRPRIKDESYAMWRRIRLIQFTQTFEGDNADPNLLDELKAEAEGVFAWAVEGAKRVADGEPVLPEAVKAATTDYRKEQDIVAQFLADECKLDSALRVGKTNFYNALDRWSKGRCGSRKEVSKRMEHHNFADGFIHGGRAAWLGVSLALTEHEPGGEHEAR